VLKNTELLSNIIANQEIHARYGGVVPELASRAHQQHIVVVTDAALKEAGINKKDLSAIAFTRGPGLLGSLLVGMSFAKAMSLALHIPLIEADHLQGHILSHFIKKTTPSPRFPFLALCVSGGHTQIVKVNNYFDMQLIGTTIDDAAGEAFDKAAKILGLPYPGGPCIDRLAQSGNPDAFSFSKANMNEYNYSFSGLKTSFLYFVKNKLAQNSGFIQENLNDLCAAIQKQIVVSLVEKLVKASQDLHIKEIVLAGGVSANSYLQSRMRQLAQKYEWNLHIPSLSLSTDNAAMIGITAYFKYRNQDFASLDITPYTRQKMILNS
jgi:N6-L-threonylcarbamoyladenine synthase